MFDINEKAFPDYFTEELINRSHFISLKKGEFLFQTNDKVVGIYYVFSGEIKAMRNLIKGTEVVMMRSQAGDYFGESALAIEYYICDALCTKNAEVAFLSKDSVMTALTNNAFSMAFFLAITKSSRRQCSRYERLRLHKAKDRMKHFLICESNSNGLLVWHSSLLELAGELAIEPETLYRVLAELEKEGMIHRNKKEIQLLTDSST